MTPDKLLYHFETNPESLKEFKRGEGSSCYITKDSSLVIGEGTNRRKYSYSDGFNDAIVYRGVLFSNPHTGQPLDDEIFAYRTAPSWATPKQLQNIPRF